MFLYKFIANEIYHYYNIEIYYEIVTGNKNDFDFIFQKISIFLCINKFIRKHVKYFSN